MRVIGLTIGPIFETILSAPSPASLWYSSFIFSNISRNLCVEIEAEGGFEFISPAHNSDTVLSDGVGKYHDRIIVIDNEIRDIKYTKELLNRIIDKVVSKTIDYFPISFDKCELKEFLNEYIQIHYVIKDIGDNEQIILSVSQELDSLELMNELCSNNDKNQFEKLFVGKSEEKRNEWIKETSLYNLVKDDGQIQVNNQIRSIDSIVEYSDDNELKKNRYFAVINSDGDRIGKLLEKLIKKEDCLDFSKLLLDYSQESARIVKDFGGMTIYAGGDDLLFLSPIVNKKQDKTVLDLCNELSKAFSKKIDKFINDKYELLNTIQNKPSLSFGISIQYHKYPLYESLNNCFSLLGYVKNMNDGKRNRTIVNVNLHSGQNFDFIYNNSSYDLIDKLYDKNGDEKKYITIINHIKEYINSIKILDKDIKENRIDKDNYINIILNFFDNDDQKKYKEYIKYVFGSYYELLKFEDPIQSRTTLKDKEEKNIRGLLSLLLFVKSINEKEEE